MSRKSAKKLNQQIQNETHEINTTDETSNHTTTWENQSETIDSELEMNIHIHIENINEPDWGIDAVLEMEEPTIPQEQEVEDTQKDKMEEQNTEEEVNNNKEVNNFTFEQMLDESKESNGYPKKKDILRGITKYSIEWEFVRRIALTPKFKPINPKHWKSWLVYYAKNLTPEILSNLALLNEIKERRISPAHIAIISARHDLLPYCEIDFKDNHDIKGDSLLHYAVRLGDVKAMEWLINQDVSINFRNNLGEIPLHLAIKMGKINCLKFLLQNGADYDRLTFDALTPMQLAIVHDQLKLIPIFIQFDPDPFRAHPESQKNPLHIAAKHNKYEIAKKLIQEYKMCPNKPDAAGFSPTHIAACNGGLEMLNLLDECGADLKTKTTSGFTALDMALANNQFKCFVFLLEKGVLIGQAKDTRTLFEHLKEELSTGIEAMIFELLHPKYWKDKAVEFAAFWYAWEPQHHTLQRLKIELNNRAKLTLLALRNEKSAAIAIAKEYKEIRKEFDKR